MICLYLHTVHNRQAVLSVTDSIFITLDLDDCGLWLKHIKHSACAIPSFGID